MSLSRKASGIRPPSRKGVKLTPEQRERLKGKTAWNKGKTLSQAHRKSLSESHKGNEPWNKGKIGVQEGPKGEKCHFWKGGITNKNYRERVSIMNSPQYRFWRRSVFERDDFTCQSCSIKGGRLQADHIKRFSDFPELRFELSNGRTLCEACHRATSTYGNRKMEPSLT